MKSLLLVSLLLITMGLCGYTCWEENGKAVRQAMNLNFTDTVIKISDGGLC